MSGTGSQDDVAVCGNCLLLAIEGYSIECNHRDPLSNQRQHKAKTPEQEQDKPDIVSTFSFQELHSIIRPLYRITSVKIRALASSYVLPSQSG